MGQITLEEATGSEGDQAGTGELRALGFRGRSVSGGARPGVLSSPQREKPSRPQDKKTKANVATNRIPCHWRNANATVGPRDSEERSGALGAARRGRAPAPCCTPREGDVDAPPLALPRAGEPGTRAGARAASPSPAPPKPGGIPALAPQAPARLSPERGSKVTTNTATTWSSSTSPSSRRPGCSSTSGAAGSSGSRLRGGSAVGRAPPLPPRPQPPACGSGACGTETAGPSAQRSSGAASPCSTMARRGEAEPPARGAGRAVCGNPPRRAAPPPPPPTGSRAARGPAAEAPFPLNWSKRRGTGFGNREPVRRRPSARPRVGRVRLERSSLRQ
ncbi:hypothetical protein P7K49_025789, partial [Saguinus oedipus]